MEFWSRLFSAQRHCSDCKYEPGGFPLGGGELAGSEFVNTALL